MSYDWLTDPLTWVNYTPAALYLAAVTLMVLSKHLWHPIHAVGAASGLIVQLMIHGPRALWSVPIALVVLTVFVWALSRTISATGIFSVCVSLAILPINGWHAVAAGLLLALAVSLTRTSLARTKLIGLSTMISMGVTPAGFTTPSLSLMPERADDHANGRTTMLPPYLLAGVVLIAAVLP